MFNRSLLQPSMLLLACFILGAGSIHAQTTHTFEVNSLADTGRQSDAPAATCTTGNTVSCPAGQCAECTLRAAIETVNALSFGQSGTIAFADYIPTNSSNPPASMFEPVNGYNSFGREVHVDGTTHPEWDPIDGIPAVIIRGDSAIPAAHGLNFGPGGAGSIVDAVAVYNFPQVGIRINADSVTVRQSHVGISAGGTGARPNAVGILVLGHENTIGHLPAVASVAPWPNVISGNSGHGVVVEGNDNLIGGNYIGLNKAGTAALGNGGSGVRVEGTGNRVGAQEFSSGFPPLSLISGNVIAGSGSDQLHFLSGADQGQVACTRIGTNAAGEVRFSSGSLVALRLDSSSNQVGSPNCRNVFAGQVAMGQAGSTPLIVNFNTFEYNFVGTNADGDNLGEDLTGVNVHTGQGHQLRDNTIGNGLSGISIGSAVVNAFVQSNHIGVDAQGNALPILFAAISSSGTSIQIGGSDDSHGNRIGNAAQGIDKRGSSSAAVIQNNWIGGLSDGTAAPVGTGIRAAGANHQIGNPGAGNHIANAENVGIDLLATSENGQLADNRIGSSPQTAGGFGPDAIGIRVAGDGHVVSQGNRIGSQDTGILVNAGMHEILHNLIGFDEDLTPRPNASFGIRLSGSENSRVIGNQVGFSNRGIRLNVGATGTVVGNNWLGVTPDLDDIGNALYGYDSSGAFNFFGTDPNTAESMPNIVGFNGSGGGVRIAGQDNLVINNRIGFGPGGQTIPNGGSGALILRGNPAGSQIGLSTFSNANFIGNSAGAGIEVRESVSDVEIGVNQVGMMGSAPGPNQGPAIHLLAGVSNILMVSPPVADSSNRLRLANSADPAIVLDPDAGTGNRIQRVVGFNISGKLIDLGPGGRDQDPGDGDSGPNNLQNFPEIHSSTAYNEDSQELTFTFQVDSDPANSNYPLAVDVYLVTQSGANHSWFGSTLYESADVGQSVTVTLPKPSFLPALSQPVFAATATDNLGNTSEMSDPFDTAPPSTDEIFRDRFEPAPEPAFSFSTQMAPTFQHPRCTTCHAVEATNFQRVNDDPPGVLPASHPVVDASTNCTSCHSSSLLPPTGTIDPGWQSAPAAMDFRGLDEATLCSMASQPVSDHSPLEHMTEDRLVLWAVGDGRVPFGNPDLPTAPPHDIEAWRALVNEWVDAGMPCD